MSFETDRWTELTQPQAEFLAGQIAAASQLAFSPAAQEAGIRPLSATIYAIRMDQQHQPVGAIMWPDPYEPYTSCIATANSRGGLRSSSFVRITGTPESYRVEGVALNLNYGGGGNLYGQQLILRHDEPNEILPPHVGLNFLLTASKKSSALNKPNPLPLNISGAKIVGIESTTTARLFRSLSSLGSNLVVAGVMGEKGMFTEQTYDLAHALLKVTITGITRNQTPGNDTLLLDSNGRPLGAVFESERDGITVIRRTDDYPDTIALATASRPRVDDNTIFVEQHAIRARGVTVDVMTLPAEAYNPQSIVSSLSLIGPNQKEAEASIDLDKEGSRVVEQKIMRLLNERAGQPI